MREKNKRVELISFLFAWLGSRDIHLIPYTYLLHTYKQVNSKHLLRDLPLHLPSQRRTFPIKSTFLTTKPSFFYSMVDVIASSIDKVITYTRRPKLWGDSLGFEYIPLAIAYAFAFYWVCLPLFLPYLPYKVKKEACLA